MLRTVLPTIAVLYCCVLSINDDDYEILGFLKMESGDGDAVISD